MLREKLYRSSQYILATVRSVFRMVYQSTRASHKDGSPALPGEESKGLWPYKTPLQIATTPRLTCYLPVPCPLTHLLPAFPTNQHEPNRLLLLKALT